MNERDDELETAEPWLRDAVLRLREPIQRSPGAVDAVVRAARAAKPDSIPLPTISLGRRIWNRLTRPEIALSPLAAAATVVILVAATFALARLSMGGRSASDAMAVTARHQFVLVAPHASSVSLVGDFNGWSLGATPLERQGAIWSVEVTLPPGRHVYAFVVDGEEWVADAYAPRAPEDEFGRPNSVILVPERGT
jgi:hypothetical protein